MIDSIKITALGNLGANINYTGLIPVVNMNGTPVTQKANLQIIGNYILSQAGGANFVQAAQATLAQSVVNAAQPNITSVGTLTGLSVIGNINSSGNLLIAVNRLRIPGGTNGYVLQTDGAGNLSWTAQSGNGGGGNASPGGANTQIQFNDAGTFGGNSGFTFDKTTGILSVNNLQLVGNAIAGNVYANSGTIGAATLKGEGGNISNIRGANVSGAVASATSATSATTAGTVTTAAQPNITSVGTLSILGVNGNITAANITANIGIFSGNGSGLSSITGANVTGTVPVANVAQYANVQPANANITNYSLALVDWIAGNHRIEAELNNLKFNANTHTLTTGALNVEQNIRGNGALQLQGLANGNTTINIGSGVGGDIDMVSNLGNINLYTANNSPWTFDQTGNLTLPGNTFAVNYANGTQVPLGGGSSNELVNGDNSFVLDVDGNVVFEGDGANNAVNRGMVWAYGAGANGVNSMVRQDNDGLTVRAWTENGGGANGYSAPVNIVTNQDAATSTWTFDGQGNLRLPGNIIAINDSGQLGAQVVLEPDLGQARIAGRSAEYTQNFNSGGWTSAEYTGTQVDITDDPNLLNFVSNNTTFTTSVNPTFSINGGEPVPYTGYGASGNNVTLYTDITADPDPTVVTSIDFYYQSESYFGIDYDDGSLNIAAAGLTIYIDNDQTQGPDINIRSGDDITIQAKDKALGTESEGGDINIYAGDGADDDGAGNTASTGGDIQITAGNGGDGNSSTGSAGGFTQIRGGSGGYAGVTNTAGPGGYVEIIGGSGGGYGGGNAELGAGGGYVSITAGSSTQEGVNGANVTITSGDAGPNALAGNVEISTPASADGPGGTWIFDGYGNLILPNNSNIATIGNVTQFNTCSNGFLGLNSYDAGGNNIASIAINSIDGLVGISTYDPITDSDYHWAFDTTGNLTLPGNTFAVNYANGTPVSIGGGGGNTGNVTFDNVTVQGVNGLNLSAGSDFTANLAYLQVRAGDVASHIHLDTGNNQAYDLILGDDQNYVQVSSTGNILLSAYDSNTNQYTWTLDYNGNLILAGGNSVIQSIANSSLDILNPNVSTMVLTPDPGYYSQSLVLDPTAPGHIHLRAPGANIDEPGANIFLGGEESSFEVGYYNGAAPNLFVHSGNNTWTFDNDGNLTLPGGNVTIGSVLGGEAILASNTPFGVVSQGNGSTVLQWIDDISNATALSAIYINSPSGNTGDVAVLTGEPGANANIWTFGNDGVLTVPGEGVLQSINDTIILQSKNTSTGNINSVYLGTSGGLGFQDSAISGNWLEIFRNGVDPQLATTGNLLIRTDSSNTAAIWTFSKTGNLTLPANTFAINYANGTQVSLGGSGSNIANGNSNVSIATANGNVVTSVNGSAILTTYSGGIKVGGSGILQSPGGAQSIVLNNSGANIPVANITTGLNVTGQNGANISGNATTGIAAINAGLYSTQLPNTIASFTSNVNNYTQVTLQNKSTGADATADYIVTADNGSDTVNYIDLGIINSGYDANTPTNSLGNIVFAADGYLYTQGNTSNASQSGGNLAIGTTVPGKNVKIFVGGVNNSAIMANISNTGMTVNGNVVANNFSGNITITGNVTGTSPNVSLVAGSFTATFDNTGKLTLPAMGGDEGGEINLGIPSSNTTLQNRVAIDVFQDRVRFFEGSANAKGAYIDLSQAGAAVSTLLNNRVSGLVNAGAFVTMDNIKATVTTSGNRGLSLATVSGTFTYNIGGNFGMSGNGSGGQSLAGQTLTTTATASIFGWGFTATGDLSTYVLTDTTNNRCYRITVQIGASFNNNSITIERLI